MISKDVFNAICPKCGAKNKITSVTVGGTGQNPDMHSGLLKCQNCQEPFDPTTAKRLAERVTE